MRYATMSHRGSPVWAPPCLHAIWKPIEAYPCFLSSALSDFFIALHQTTHRWNAYSLSFPMNPHFWRSEEGQWSYDKLNSDVYALHKHSQSHTSKLVLRIWGRFWTRINSWIGRDQRLTLSFLKSRLRDTLLMYGEVSKTFSWSKYRVRIVLRFTLYSTGIPVCGLHYAS